MVDKDSVKKLQHNDNFPKIVRQALAYACIPRMVFANLVFYWRVSVEVFWQEAESSASSVKSAALADITHNIECE